MKIKINKQEYTLKFGLNSARLYCKKRDIELWEYEQDLTKLNLEKLSIEALEILGDLIYTGIVSADENTTIVYGDIIDCLSDKDFLASIFKEFEDTNSKGSGTKKK